MPASHSNGPPTCTLRHPASWASPNGSDTLLGSPWISGPRSYLVWFFKWVPRCSPSETKIQTPVCARCAESFVQCCQTWHPRFWMDKPQMKNGVLWNASSLRDFVPRTGARPVGMGLSRAAWVKLNRLRTSVVRFHSSMYKWGLSPSPNCECGASEQTADHVLTACPIGHHIGRIGHHMEHEVWRFWLTKLDAGLITPLPASDSGSAAVWGSKRINPRPQSCLCFTWSGYPLHDDDDD